MINLLKKKIDLYIKEEDLDAKSINVQLAYSGGIDSSCLLDALSKLKSRNEINIFLTYINYSTSSYSEKVKNHIDSIDIDLIKKNIFNVNIDNELNFESEARKIRYNFLKKIHYQHNIDLTFTAHHLNDQIETIIMKFIDGSDYVSMQGIRKKYNFLFRPILELEKRDILSYAIKNNVTYFEDPTNEDISYKRNKVRKFLVPYVKSDQFLSNKVNMLNENSISKFQKLKNRIEKDLKSLKYNKRFKYVFIEIDNFKKYNLVDSKIYLVSILKFIFNVKMKNRNKNFWLSVNDFILKSSTGSLLNLSKNIFIQKNREGFFLYDHRKISDIFSNKTKIRNDLNWGIGKFLLESKTKSNKVLKDRILIDQNHFLNGLFVRNWCHGDRISNSNKKISDMFIKKKIPLFLKEKYPIIEDCDGNIIWVPGIYFDKKYSSDKIEGQRILWME
ncbi:MAG: tRNA lysidine(34) synthetase TilS [Candidatus Marinimicrobia bacterium]|nr:tRNA lysidine(34) synthetase TilS [Candidatus Neomarinimicrobiota bacterium]